MVAMVANATSGVLLLKMLNMILYCMVRFRGPFMTGSTVLDNVFPSSVIFQHQLRYANQLFPSCGLENLRLPVSLYVANECFLPEY